MAAERQPEHDLARPDPRPPGRRAGQQRERPERQPGERHALPEPVARAAERGRERRLGGEETDAEGAGRDARAAADHAAAAPRSPR